MKKILFLVVLLVCSQALLFSQDTTAHKSIFFIRPYIENGVNFIQNEELQELYDTKSMFHLGLGVQIGHPEVSRVIPFIQYSGSDCKSDDFIDRDDQDCRKLEIEQILLGAVFPIIKSNEMYFNLKFAYCFSHIKETGHDIDDIAQGMVMGISIEKILFGHSRIFTNLSYCFQQIDSLSLKDFNTVTLSVGFIY